MKMKPFRERLYTNLFFTMIAFTILSFHGCSNDPKESTSSVTPPPTEIVNGTDAANEEPLPTDAPLPTEAPVIKTSTYSSLAAVHDPSIAKSFDGTYYIFGSHMEAAKSDNLFTFRSFATGVNSNNKLFTGLFDSAAFDWVGKNEEGGYSVWAPDVIYNETMGKWCMYFCTTSDWNTSTLCLATSDSIEGPYTFEANLIHSGFMAEDIERTNVIDILGYNGEDRNYYTSSDYNSTLWPNALDPSVFYDKEGRLFMVYGSWSGGIFILELDKETGLVIHPEDDKENGVDKYFGKHLLGYGHKSCEGPYIIYSEEADYYYLFVTYGGLTRTGGYNMRMFRSKNPDGPYTDAARQTWLTDVSNHSGYGVKVMGNYMLPSLSKAYMAPGHNSAMIDDDGRIYLVYHTRFDDGTEGHQPRVHQMFVNEEEWLVTAPFAFNEFTGTEEKIVKTGYQIEDIIGTYYFLNHMSDTSANIQKPRNIDLNADGSITGAYEGSWKQTEGSAYATININGVIYKGVFFKQLDEAFQEVMTFTCVSDKNMSVWGVKYK